MNIRTIDFSQVAVDAAEDPIQRYRRHDLTGMEAPVPPIRRTRCLIS